jgi:hypothetical protein
MSALGREQTPASDTARPRVTSTPATPATQTPVTRNPNGY